MEGIRSRLPLPGFPLCSSPSRLRPDLTGSRWTRCQGTGDVAVGYRLGREDLPGGKAHRRTWQDQLPEERKIFAVLLSTKFRSTDATSSPREVMSSNTARMAVAAVGV